MKRHKRASNIAFTVELNLLPVYFFFFALQIQALTIATMKSRSEMMHTDSLSTSKPPPSPIGSNTTLNHIPLSGPESINETSLPDRNQSMWSRMLRHFTIQSPIIHRLLVGYDMPCHETIVNMVCQS